MEWESFTNYDFCRNFTDKTREFFKVYLFRLQNSPNDLKFNKQNKKEQKRWFSPFSSLISYLAETFAKKGQDRKNGDGFLPRRFLLLKYLEIWWSLKVRSNQSLIITLVTFQWIDVQNQNRDQKDLFIKGYSREMPLVMGPFLPIFSHL